MCTKKHSIANPVENFEKTIQQSLYHLSIGNTILYPTDTVWGIGCDALNPSAIDKVYSLKQRDSNKPLLCIVSDIEMLHQYVEVKPEIECMLQEIKRPTTIIYPKAKNLPSNLLARNGSIAIRLVRDPFCTPLIQQFGKPIVSTSANLSEHPTPKTFKEIGQSILERVDYIVNLQTQKKQHRPSRLIQVLENGTIICLRE